MAQFVSKPFPLPLAHQDRLLRRDWPFRTILLGDDIALWRGRVYGLSQGYEVAILYVRKPFQPSFEYAHAWFPEVHVLSPRLERRSEEPDTPIPHVYDEVDRPNLCLFDPAFDGWDASQAIAATTVPWIAEWLRFYEAWHATGLWHGGGRDHGETTPPRATSDRNSSWPLARSVAKIMGMDASRAIIATIPERAAGPLDRRTLFYRLRDLDLWRPLTPNNDPFADFTRNAA